MNSTLTIRLDKDQREALRKRARAEKKTEGELARELLATELEQAPVWDDISDLKGCVRLPRQSNDTWRTKLRGRNWRT